MEKKLNRVQGDLESKMGCLAPKTHSFEKVSQKDLWRKKKCRKKEEIKDVQVRFKMGSFWGGRGTG